MDKKDNDKKEVVRYKSNPFLKDMIVPTTGKKVRISSLGKDDNVLINQATGEHFGTHVTTTKKVDSEQFIKLFTANIALTFDLKSPGIKALTVLIWTVQNKALSKDEIDLDTLTLEEFLDEHKLSKPPVQLSLATFSRGINELEKAQIVAKTMRKGRYFINPSFMFNGDRVAFTTLIQRVMKKEDQQELPLDQATPE